MTVVEVAVGRDGCVCDDDADLSFRESLLAALTRLFRGSIYIQERITVFLLVLKLESETQYSPCLKWMILGQVIPFNKAHENFCLKPEHPFINLSPESYLSTSQSVVLG